jgi:type I restriction enzyme R subunit
MGNRQLAIIAHELIVKLCENVTIDWTIKETVRAMVRRVLKKYDYPPGLCEEATRTVLEQAELLRAEWAGN